MGKLNLRVGVCLGFIKPRNTVLLSALAATLLLGSSLEQPGRAQDIQISGTVTYSTDQSTSGSIYVGYGSPGTLIIDGGTTSSGNGYIGHIQAGTATVTGTSSSWNMNSSLLVGDNYTGALTISNGASVSTFVLFTGVGSSGTTTVTGTGSTLTSSNLSYIGSFGGGQWHAYDRQWRTRQRHELHRRSFFRYWNRYSNGDWICLDQHR